MLLLIDNYDSFTWNLWHRLGELGATDVLVRRNDDLTVQDAIAMGPAAIILSPGPCDPDRAGISLPLVRAASGRCPILGVCLGHQTIAQAFGAVIERAPRPMHGKVDTIAHDRSGLFAGLETPIQATRYHSLAAAPASLPGELVPNAWSGDGVLMGLRHRELPIHGLQFHPESIETEAGYHLLGRFLALVATPEGGAA